MKTIYPFMGLALCGIAAQAQEKPNFLIIQCDHLTQRVVGAYGHTQDCTLPIDEVASRGVIFSNAYVGCPLSQPSRAALWSGMMPHQTNVRSNSSEPINTPIPENVPTLGSLFSENGYEAVHFGKTHDMGSLRGFKHKEPVAKPFTDPEFPVNNDSFLDVGTCEDVVSYLRPTCQRHTSGTARQFRCRRLEQHTYPGAIHLLQPPAYDASLPLE